MFTSKDLKNMIVPLFLEQLLLMLVGIVDTFNIAYCGEAAVSGVSLVNQFSTIFIMLFTALASGGAVIVSQYIGSKEREKSIRSASQLLSFSVVFSLALSVMIFLFHKQLLYFLFGKVEQNVMEACITYMRLSVYSYVFLAVYNAGAAMQRSIGRTKVTMYISIVSNFINIVGNCIGVYVLHAGVAGVAWPTFIARLFSAIVITWLCFRSDSVKYRFQDIFSFDGDILKRICRVAVPNGIENAVFQFVKVALSSIVALFGTYQIAANGVAQSIWSLAALMSTAMGPVFVTVIGQCMGAGDKVQARSYFRKLIRIAVLLSAGWNLFILGVTPLFLQFYNLTAETKTLIIQLVVLHNIFNSFALPLASPLGAGLRAAGDVRFTMVISIITTIFIRLVFSYIFALVLHMGVMGIAVAMCMDWIFKGGIYYLRYRSDRWENFKLI